MHIQLAITTLQSGILTQFLTPLMLCVLILYKTGGTYSLKSPPNERFFEKLFMAILFTLRTFARNLLGGNRRRNTFSILFWCLAWGSNTGFTSNEPSQYLLDYGEFYWVELKNISLYFLNASNICYLTKNIFYLDFYWTHIFIDYTNISKPTSKISTLLETRGIIWLNILWGLMRFLSYLYIHNSKL